MPFVEDPADYDVDAHLAVFDKLPAHDRPLVTIAWKSSCVCLGFRCPCGHDTHEDTEFDAILVVRCGGCGAHYALPHSIPLVPLDRDELGPVRVFEITDGVNDETEAPA